MGYFPISSPHLYVPADVSCVSGGVDVSCVVGGVDVSGDVVDDIGVGDGDSVGELLHLFSAV